MPRMCFYRDSKPNQTDREDSQSRLLFDFSTVSTQASTGILSMELGEERDENKCGVFAGVLQLYIQHIMSVIKHNPGERRDKKKLILDLRNED